MEVVQENTDASFEASIRALEAELANAGVHLTVDAQARQLYAKQVRAMASHLRAQAATGRITWANAAQQAQAARNLIMELVRSRSTPVGLALAQHMKSEGRTLNALVARKAQQLYGRSVDFNKLTSLQKDAVYAEIVKSAGRSNPKVTAVMRQLSYAGRSLIVVSIAMSAYTIASAENKLQATGREAAITGAGIGGGIAGGALAGLACGPGAPVCVTVGAFVGGALAAFGVSFVW